MNANKPATLEDTTLNEKQQDNVFKYITPRDRLLVELMAKYDAKLRFSSTRKKAKWSRRWKIFLKEWVVVYKVVASMYKLIKISWKF